MADPYRAMCAELAEEVEHLWSIVREDNNESHSLAVRARALLDQPEPVIPVKQHIFPTPSQAAECGGPCYEGSYCPEACDCGLYRSPTPQPPADDEAAELAAELRHFVAEYQQMRGLDPENIYSIQQGDAEKEAHLRISRLTRIADLLEHPTLR